MMDVDMETRMQSLELGQQQLTSSTNDIKDTLKTLMDRLPAIKAEPASNTANTITAAPDPAVKQRRIKPNPPSEFDGSRSKGRAFINSVMLYVSLCPLEFVNDQQRIHWVLTFMKKDRAATFAHRTMRMEQRNGRPRFSDWKEFLEAFVSLFCPANEATHALMRLETTDYYQKKRDVDEYIDEFQELIDLSGYTDPLVTAIKFRRGLNEAIRTKIAELGTNRPADDDPERWYEMARELDLNRIASEAFEASYNKSHTAPSMAAKTARSSVLPRALVTATPRHAPTTQQSHLTTKTPNALSTSRACYRCGSLEHLAPQCNQRFDIRSMTADEKDDLLEQLLADKDTATEGAIEETDDCEETGESPTGFVQRSG